MNTSIIEGVCILEFIGLINEEEEGSHSRIASVFWPEHFEDVVIRLWPQLG